MAIEETLRAQLLETVNAELAATTKKENHPYEGQDTHRCRSSDHSISLCS